MTIKNNVDWSSFTTPEQGFELFGNSIRKSFSYDSYGNRTKFSAVVLSNPLPIAPEDIKFFTNTATKGPASNKVDKFVYRGRIIGQNSPHQFLPDPCNATFASNPEQALNIIAMHTLFVSNIDDGDAGTLPRINSIVEVELTKNAFGYNLQYGKHLNVINNPDTEPGNNVDCDSLQGIIANADSSISIGSLGEAEVRSYRGSGGAQDVENGKLHVRTWRLPELIPERFEERSLYDAPYECLITKKGILDEQKLQAQDNRTSM